MTTRAVERRDEPGTPPAIWLLALRFGLVSGALAGIFWAIVTWLRSGEPAQAGLAWARVTAIGGGAFAALYSIALRLSTPTGKRVESTEQRAVLRVKLPQERAFAVAVKALRGLDEALHDVDLTTGTASVSATAKEPFFGTFRLRVAVRVTSPGNAGESQVVVESCGVPGAMDFGATRALIDRVARRIDEAIATGHTAAQAIGLDALPAAVQELFRASSYRVVGLRSLRRDAPAILVNLLDEHDTPSFAVVFTLSRPVNEAAFRAAAVRARASGASRARVGNGVAILPLVADEAPGKTAARVHHALLASGDPSDTATTLRMRWPRR